MIAVIATIVVIVIIVALFLLSSTEIYGTRALGHSHNTKTSQANGH